MLAVAYLAKMELQSRLLYLGKATAPTRLRFTTMCFVMLSLLLILRWALSLKALFNRLN
jgi:hypothetical protein